MFRNGILAISTTALLLLVSCRFFEQKTPGNRNWVPGDSQLGNGESAVDSGEETSSKNKITPVKTLSSLPACDQSTLNQVFYVESSQEYFYCAFDGSEYSYRPIEVDPKDVLIQNCAVKNLIQESEVIAMGDASCAAGLGGIRITIGCDLNQNGQLDSNSSEASDTSRNICYTSAPSESSADLALAVSSAGTDSANCQVATPCLTFAAVISKVPKVINHAISITIEGGMTLTEQAHVQGYTLGSQGKLIITSADDATDWQIDGENSRDYGIKIEGVSGTGTLLIHRLQVSNAKVAGVYIDSSVTTLGKVTTTSNGTNDEGAGLFANQSARIGVLASGANFGISDGPFPIVSSGNSGDGIRISTGSNVDLGDDVKLSIADNSRHGVNVISDSELNVGKLDKITASGEHALYVNDSDVSLTGETEVDPSAGTGGAEISVSTSEAVYIEGGADVTLANVTVRSTASTGIISLGSSMTIRQSAVNGSGSHGYIGRESSSLETFNSAFDSNGGHGLRVDNSKIRINDESSSSIVYVRNNTEPGIRLTDYAVVRILEPYTIELNDCDGTNCLANGDSTAIAIAAGATFYAPDQGEPKAICRAKENVSALGCTN